MMKQSEWLIENESSLKEDYETYKSDFDIDGGLPRCERLTYKQWAKQQYEAYKQEHYI